MINEGQETGTAEHFRFKADAAEWIGKPSDDHLVGAVIVRDSWRGAV